MSKTFDLLCLMMPRNLSQLESVFLSLFFRSIPMDICAEINSWRSERMNRLFPSSVLDRIHQRCWLVFGVFLSPHINATFEGKKVNTFLKYFGRLFPINARTKYPFFKYCFNTILLQYCYIISILSNKSLLRKRVGVISYQTWTWSNIFFVISVNSTKVLYLE